MTYLIKGLKDIVELQYGKGISKEDRNSDGKYPVYGANGVLDYADKYLIEGEAVIIGRKGSAGELTRVSGKFWPSDVTYYVFGNDKIDIDYLFHALKNLNLQRLAVGVKPGINRNRVYELQIPLPPLPEQKKIVAKLESVLGKIKEAKKLRAEAESATASLLAAELHKIFEEGKKKGWAEKNFGDVLLFKTGKLDSNATVIGGEYPFFTCAQQTSTIDSYSFDQKAVLLAGNNAAGKYSVKYYEGKFDAYQRTYVISVKNEKETDYLFLKNYISHILNDLKDLSVGANTKFLTLKILNRIQIPLPPLPEQKKIVAHLDALSQKIQTLRAAQAETAAALTALEQSVLHNAFNQ